MDKQHSARSDRLTGSNGFPVLSDSVATMVPPWQRHRGKGAFDGVDRRVNPRFLPVEGAVAFLRSGDSPLQTIGEMSFGDIGLAVIRALPSKLGRIKDISLNGLAFYYVEPATCVLGGCALDILCAHRGFYLGDLDYEVVTDISKIDDSDFDTIQTGQLAVRFMHMTDHQKRLLAYFIARHTRRPA